MQDKLDQLKSHLARVSDLTAAAWLLSWDQRVMMPPGGTRARADQIGTLFGLAHRYFVDEEVGALLDDLSDDTTEQDGDSFEARLITVNREKYQKAIRLSQQLVEDVQRTGAVARDAWHKAKSANDFDMFAPHLEAVVELQIEKAKALAPDANNPYDGLLDDYERGMTYDIIDEIFSGLKPHLVELIAAIESNQDAVNVSVVHGHFDSDAQMDFSRKVTAAISYDYDRGRLDLAAHPFTSSPLNTGDVRITTRVDETFFPSCLMASIHEAGHAIHFQNFADVLYRTNLMRPGLALAESQSRFYENVLGRSWEFWQVWYPELQAAFPQFTDVPLRAFYQALNNSQPSLIRVEADEVTYGMHIMLRFELENELINGRMQVRDLPDAWNEHMQAYLGISPSNDAEGVLQDIHWSQGAFGYFPDYLLGSILSSQLWDAMVAAHPAIPSEVEMGQYGTLNQWLSENVQQHGGMFTFTELAEMATGQAFTWQPYMNYLKTKYTDIYGL